MFTDVVGSTDRAAALGDRRWIDLLDAHDDAVRRQLTAFRGREIDTGDGFLATFDGPHAASVAARAIRSAATDLEGVDVRVGLHDGRDRTPRRRHRGSRGPHQPAGVGSRVAGRDRCIEHGEGSGRRFRHRVRRPGRARAEGNSWQLEAVPRSRIRSPDPSTDAGYGDRMGEHARLETDYLVVGAGAMGVAFVDSLIEHSDADVVMVDRRHRAGGHWLDAYPFVQLHQPSANYGVNSTRLGRRSESSRRRSDAGFYERASGTEICGYFDEIMRHRLLRVGSRAVLPDVRVQRRAPLPVVAERRGHRRDRAAARYRQRRT